MATGRILVVDEKANAARPFEAALRDEDLTVETLAAVVRRLRDETQQLRERLAERYRFTNLVGDSPEFQRVLKTAQQVSGNLLPILISGEAGTGKQVVAAAIHQNSARKDQPFVTLHCAGLTDSVLESELFGHERGALTGAASQGRFELAAGGTLFVDEVGDVPPNVQVKLLRVLQEHTFERVGGTHPVASDVRLIAATTKDLKALAAAGRFHAGLGAQLSIVNLDIPPLRARSSDIAALVSHFVHKFAAENTKRARGVSAQALAALLTYRWPGNVRELESVIRRATAVAETEIIELEHLALEQEPGQPEAGAPVIPGWSLADIERYAIMTTLAAESGSTSRAAELLGISVRKIQYKLQEYGAAPKSERPVFS